jgi:hypothetical protein
MFRGTQGMSTASAYLLLVIIIFVVIVKIIIFVIVFILVVFLFHFVVIVILGDFVENRIQRDRMCLRYFQFRFTLRAAQDFSLLNLVFVHIDFRGTLWAAEHGNILQFDLF